MCRIFSGTDSILKKLVEAYNGAKGVKEKQYCAEDILVEVETLLLCPNYNNENSDCLKCHSMSRNYIQKYECLVSK
ncbi:MAG: hypothetical protein AB1498_03355 [bacterium]